METLLKRYADLVIKVQLRLAEGDSLSINTEASTMGFARLLANQACMATRESVMIVETNKGKVVQAYPIEPQEKEVFRPPIRMKVMCHLIDLDAHPYHQVHDLEEAAQEVATLARFGHLSEPVFLDRRIAVPWAIVPYPGSEWASHLLGEPAGDEQAWTLFSSLYRLDSDWVTSFWEEQGNLLDYRKQVLNTIGCSTVQLVSDGWLLSAKLAPNTVWAGGRAMLANGRTFTPCLPIQALHASLDLSSANGSFAASLPFNILGTEVRGATFTVKDGKVVAFDAESGKDALGTLLGIDEGACIVSELSIADNDTIENRYLRCSIHPHFAREITTTLVLGGFSLDTLTDHENDEDIRASRLSESLVKLEIPVGDSHLSLSLTPEDGFPHEVMVEGVYTL